MSRFGHICTDPSHPPMIRNISQETLYQRVSRRVTEQTDAGMSREDVACLVSREFISQLATPSDCVEEGFRLQQMRQHVAREWGEVFCKLDNLGHLTGWFINECDRDGDELHFVLCLFALEAIRNVFATVNQLRGALTQDTFGYWRTLYETLVNSRFILQFSEQDAELPGRFLYHTNSRYLKFYRRFAPADDEHTSDNMWAESDKHYALRYPQWGGKGEYGWAYPLITNRHGQATKKPSFGQLIDAVDRGSKFSDVYYDVATTKSHGRFVWSPLMVRPDGRGTHIDGFNVGGVALVLELMMPLFREILENTSSSCGTPAHGTVMDVVKAVIEDIGLSVARIKAADPRMHGSLDPNK